MKFNRQQILLAVLVLFVVANVGDWALSSMVQGPLEERRSRTAELKDLIEKREQLLSDTRKAGQRLEIWQHQSLPADAEIARSLYRSWLLELVEQAKLANPRVDSGSPANRKGLYRALSFSIHGQGTLDQFTRLVFAFSQAGHLHRIQTIELNPIGRTGRFEIALGIEALILPDAEHEDRLTDRPSTQLASLNLVDYALISDRNIFGLGSVRLDRLEHSYVTAITHSEGRPTVWITDRVQDAVLKLENGATFRIGEMESRIVDIGERDVVFESDGERWLLAVGESFSQAFALPAEF